MAALAAADADEAIEASVEIWLINDCCELNAAEEVNDVLAEIPAATVAKLEAANAAELATPAALATTEAALEAVAFCAEATLACKPAAALAEATKLTAVEAAPAALATAEFDAYELPAAFEVTLTAELVANRAESVVLSAVIALAFAVDATLAALEAVIESVDIFVAAVCAALFDAVAADVVMLVATENALLVAVLAIEMNTSAPSVASDT